jgi:UPF0755 protein
VTSTDLYDDEAYPYDPEPEGHWYDDHEPRRPSRLLRVVLASIVLAVLVGGLGAVWIQRKISPPGGPGAAVEVTIPTGSSTSQIAALLERSHVITSATFFRYYIRVKGEKPFESGLYHLRRNQSFDAVISILRKGGEIPYHRLTIPEGKTLRQIADLVGKLPGHNADAFLQLAQSGQIRSRYQPASVQTLEGLLFPDTYNIGVKDDDAAVLKRMVAQFDQKAGQLGFDAPDPALKVSPYQALIVASLVETESKVDGDRAKIAQVIYNRMAKGMPLQIDATVIYARGGQRRPNGQVLYSDLEVSSPYNTYKVKGLPPTPIAGIGAASLDAALHPEPGPWLFYVKYQNDGTHAFATTGAEHQRNVADAKRRGVNP